MATDEQPFNVGRQTDIVALKQEGQCLPEEQRASATKFAEKIEPQQFIKSEVDDFDSDNPTHASQLFTINPQTFDAGDERIKTELTLDEEFLWDNEDSDSTPGAHESSQCVLETADNQKPIVSIAGESSESCIVFPKQFMEIYRKEAPRKQVLQCELCFQCYSNRSDLYWHLKKRHSYLPRQYTCEECGSQYIYKHGSERHVITRAKDRAPDSACRLCDGPFQSAGGLRQLRQPMKQSLLSAEHFCEHCGARFTLKAYLKRHMSHCNFKSNKYECKNSAKRSSKTTQLHKETAAAPWQCGICERTFTEKLCLRSHIIRGHSIDNNNVINKLISEVPTAMEVTTGMDEAIATDVNDKIPHACASEQLIPVTQTLDDVSEDSKIDLDAAFDTKDSSLLSCRECDKVFPSIDDWLEHMKRYTVGANNKCERCGVRFPSKRAYEKHILSCHLIESASSAHQYKCELCENAYVSKCALAMHMKHHPSFTWKCSICMKEFPKMISCHHHIIISHQIPSKNAPQNYIQAKDLRQRL